MTRGLWVMVMLAGCGADPCAGIEGTPTVEIGGASFAGEGFETFADGADRELVQGPQGGMHVWMQARITNLCPETARMDGRAVDAVTRELYYFSGGVLDFVEVEPGVFELSSARAMILCPPPMAMPVIDHPMRFVVSVTDGDGRHAESELGFVPRCRAPTDCAALCGP